MTGIDMDAPPRAAGRRIWRVAALILAIGALTGLVAAVKSTRAAKSTAAGSSASTGSGATASGAPATGRGAAGRAAPVATALARLGDVPVYVNGLGTVTPFYNLTVRTRVDGELMRVPVAEGTLVARGAAARARIRATRSTILGERMTAGVQLIKASGGRWDRAMLPR